MKDSYIKDACHAHSNLTVYAAVIAVLEGGVLYGGRESAAHEIIDICRHEIRKELRLHDAAVDAELRAAQSNESIGEKA